MVDNVYIYIVLEVSVSKDLVQPGSYMAFSTECIGYKQLLDIIFLVNNCHLDEINPDIFRDTHS